MKTTFLTLAALAVSAFAAPTAVQRQNEVAEAVKTVDGIVVESLGVGQIADGITKEKRDISNVNQLESTLTSTISSIKADGASIDNILDSFKSGDLTKSAAKSKVNAQIEDMHYQLSEIVSELTDAAGIPVDDSDVDDVLNLTVTLVSEVLTIVNGAVKVLGLSSQLTSILNSVFSLLKEILTLLVAIVPGLVGGLVASLSPLLAGLGNGLLAPLLTPVAGLLAGLTGSV